MKAAVTIISMLILGMMLGCTETATRSTLNAERSYDPNAPELSFLAKTDPNWVRNYGDTKETQELYNLSLLRAMVLRDEKVTSIIARRLIALEQQHVDPNVATDPNEVK